MSTSCAVIKGFGGALWLIQRKPNDINALALIKAGCSLVLWLTFIFQRVTLLFLWPKTYSPLWGEE